jgi:sugar/nucleoside kinase (ribokinase family)
MTRQRTIVGLGETLLVEYPERTEAAGLASLVARHAARLGHVGVAISRVGQDAPADELTGLLLEAGVDVSHLQTDPDLATGRVTVRPVGGVAARYLDTRVAFDNLQADFDLEDVAQQADAVVYGMLTRRSGQTRSEENRFLEACSTALKIFDLTNRGLGASDNGPLDRGHAMSGLALADAMIIDRPALDALRPASRDRPMHEGVRELLRETSSTFGLAVEPAGDRTTITACAADQHAAVELPADRGALVAAVVALLVGMLRGKAMETALDAAVRVAEHVHAHPDEPIPAELLDDA